MSDGITDAFRGRPVYQPQKSEEERLLLEKLKKITEEHAEELKWNLEKEFYIDFNKWKGTSGMISISDKMYNRIITIFPNKIIFKHGDNRIKEINII